MPQFDGNLKRAKRGFMDLNEAHCRCFLSWDALATNLLRSSSWGLKSSRDESLVFVCVARCAPHDMAGSPLIPSVRRRLI